MSFSFPDIVVSTQQMLSEWSIGKWIHYFLCFEAQCYRYQRQILELRTREKRLKMRKLDTGESTNTGEDEEKKWHVERTLWIQSEADELRMCKSRDSLATRNDHLAIYYEANSGKGGGARMTRGKHKLVATTYAVFSLSLQCRVWHCSPLRTFSTFLFHYFFTFKNGLKFINLVSPLF